MNDEELYAETADKIIQMVQATNKRNRDPEVLRTQVKVALIQMRMRLDGGEVAADAEAAGV